jgi:ABC-type transport system substrate-binding protein
LESNYDSENKKLNVRIKPNSRFDNGDLITTDDVIYSYSLASDIRVDSVERAKYEGMEFTKISDTAFVIDFKKSYSNMDELLTLGIVSKKDIENESPDGILLSEKNQKPIASGIYKVKEITKDESGINNITLSYNNYNENIPNHRKIIFNFLDNEELLANENGSNIYDIILIDKYSKVDYTNYKYITPRITALFLNPNKSQIFGKKEVRKALYANIDRNYITKNILSAGATSTYDLFPASSSSTPLINSLPPSLTGASGTPIGLTYLDNKRNDDLAIYLVARANELGLNLVANPVNQDEIQSVIKNRNFDVLLYTIQIEDLASLYAFWHSSQKNAPGLNITNYVSKGFDENLDKLRYSDNPEEIEVAKTSMLTEFYDEFPYIPLYTAYKNIAVKNNNEIQIDEYVSNPKYLFNKISTWSNQKEYIYNFLEKYTDKIKKISKLIY